mgnify:CR=1 FL=1
MSLLSNKNVREPLLTGLAADPVGENSPTRIPRERFGSDNTEQSWGSSQRTQSRSAIAPKRNHRDFNRLKYYSALNTLSMNTSGDLILETPDHIAEEHIVMKNTFLHQQEDLIEK